MLNSDEGLVYLLNWRQVMLRLLVFVLLFFLMAGGCRPSCQPGMTDQVKQLLSEQFNHKPHIQRGSLPSPGVWTSFLDPGHLGAHRYEFTLSEKNGIIYTCKAGHIDIYHVREAADWTAFLTAKTFKHLNNDDIEFSFKLKEGAICFVRLTYPQTWELLLPKIKEYITYDISISLGQYFAYTAQTWHEIMTWYGYKSGGFYPEFPSAFSWEDNFSNLLGSYIGVLGLQDTKHAYDEAVTLALNKELEKLGVQPAAVARHSAKSMKGLWFSGKLLGPEDMKKRNFDIGIDDGFVTPSIVPDVCECEGTKAQPYRVPNLDCLSKYGFSMKFEIEPREWEKDKILSIIYPDKKTRGKCIEPAKHFAAIMSRIMNEAEKKYGFHVARSSIN
ncbi:MAG: DUF4056 domain-containing protein [Phycisphaerae bacterium]|nr:DUF4056 domain-containing protein [Phycisphaerae bacterium]